MSCISVTKAVNSLVNKIKFREKRIAQYYREIHDMVSELEDYMGNATELIYRNRLILKRHADFSILPIEADIFSKSIAYCYHEIIDRQLELIKQHEQRLEELKQEIEENKKTSEAINSIVNKQIQEIDIQSIQTKSTTKKIEYKQVNPNNKLYSYLVFLIIIAISLLGALLFTATLRESAVVLLFSVLTGISFGWGIFLFYTYQNLEQYKNELDKSKGKIVERELLVNRIIQGIEKQKQQIEQEKQQIREQNEANVKVVNNKLQQSRQLDATRKIQISQYRDKISKYREIIKRLNQENNNLKEEIAKFQTNSSQTLELQNRIEILEKEIQEKQNAIDSFKEQIEAGEHTKRKADNLERDYKQLFEKYHNRESEIQTLESNLQTLKSDLNNSKNENKRLINQMTSLESEYEKLQKQYGDYLDNDSELKIEFKNIEAENQELERKNQKLCFHISSLETKNEKLQSQLETIQSKYSDLDNRIKLVQKEKQELEKEKTILNSQKKSLESEKEKLQIQNNNIQSKYQEFKIIQNKNQTLQNENDRLNSRISSLEIEKEEFESVLEENQTLQNKNDKLSSKISSLEMEKEELLAENSDYLIENSKFKVQIKSLQEECLSLRKEKINNNNFNQRDYHNLQVRCNTLQKENEELRYNFLKLDSKKAQEIIRRNSLDEDTANNSQPIPVVETEPAPSEINRANSEQDSFYEIADEIIKKACYSKEELIALYRRFNMSIFSGNAKINGWTDDIFGDNLIFEENNRFVIDQEIAAKVRNREVGNE